MAQLKDLIVNGASRVIGKLFTSDMQVEGKLEAKNKVVLTSITYGDELPASGQEVGQIFFKKVE